MECSTKALAMLKHNVAQFQQRKQDGRIVYTSLIIVSSIVGYWSCIILPITQTTLFAKVIQRVVSTSIDGQKELLVTILLNEKAAESMVSWTRTECDGK